MVCKIVYAHTLSPSLLHVCELSQYAREALVLKPVLFGMRGSSRLSIRLSCSSFCWLSMTAMITIYLKLDKKSFSTLIYETDNYLSSIVYILTNIVVIFTDYCWMYCREGMLPLFWELWRFLACCFNLVYVTEYKLFVFEITILVTHKHIHTCVYIRVLGLKRIQIVNHKHIQAIE